mgnify:CR=1 FL=1
MWNEIMIIINKWNRYYSVKYTVVVAVLVVVVEAVVVVVYISNTHDFWMDDQSMKKKNK